MELPNEKDLPSYIGCTLGLEAGLDQHSCSLQHELIEKTYPLRYSLHPSPKYIESCG